MLVEAGEWAGCEAGSGVRWGGVGWERAKVGVGGWGGIAGCWGGKVERGVGRGGVDGGGESGG